MIKMMIKPLSFLLLFTAVLFFGGCGQSSHDEHSDAVVHPGDAASSVVPLNDGKKWQLDEPTRINISRIRHTIMDTTFSGHLDYAAALKAETGTLVKQCRMSGPDHDALHVWLTGFLAHQKQLADPATADSAHTRLKQDIVNLETAFE